MSYAHNIPCVAGGVIQNEQLDLPKSNLTALVNISK